MDRGIYAASSGGLYNMRRLAVEADNLANVNTVGFKGERLVAEQQQFSDTLASTIRGVSSRAQGDLERTPGVVNPVTLTDFTPGPVAPTGNPLDVALTKPNQFFAVRTPNGEEYTRAGSFSLNVDGNLVTADGMEVQGDGGPVTLPPGQAQISGTGMITVDGAPVGKLKVVEFDKVEGLTRTGGTRFGAQGQSPQTVEPELIPASVEMSNVQAVTQMVDMISANRAFESYAKVAKTIDELNDVSVRTIRNNG